MTSKAGMPGVLPFLASDSKTGYLGAPVRFLLNVGDQTAAELIFTAVLLLVRRAGKNCRTSRAFPLPFLWRSR
jgi:hypothetical protein